MREQGPYGSVVLRMEVEQMRHSIQTVLAEHAADTQAMVELAVKHYIEGGGMMQDIGRAVASVGQESVKRMVDWTLGEAMRDELVRKELQPRMVKAIKAVLARDLRDY